MSKNFDLTYVFGAGRIERLNSINEQPDDFFYGYKYFEKKYKTNVIEMKFPSEKRNIKKYIDKILRKLTKLPIYLGWAGCLSTTELVEEYSKKFSILVKHKVIESNWVPGVLEFIRNKTNKQSYFIITATPQAEIEEIINELELTKFFHKIIGAPISKSNAIKSILDSFSIEAEQSIMFGDSISDYEAATKNGITFLLRRTSSNEDLQRKLNCIMFDDFLDNIWCYLDKK